MNQLQVFEHSDFGELGLLLIDGREFFPATACARILGYADPYKAIKQHTLKDGWATHPVIDNLGRQQNMKFINEGNLYRLIVHSKLPTSVKFERWIFEQVLPQIRKTGSYTQANDHIPLEMVMEIVQTTATAMATEFVRQIVPLIRQDPEKNTRSTVSIEYVETTIRNASKCKLETFPEELRQKVDSLIEEMQAEQTLNFSRIARYCTLQGHPISSPSVKRYFDRRMEPGS